MEKLEEKSTIKMNQIQNKNEIKMHSDNNSLSDDNLDYYRWNSLSSFDIIQHKKIKQKKSAPILAKNKKSKKKTQFNFQKKSRIIPTCDYENILEVSDEKENDNSSNKPKENINHLMATTENSNSIIIRPASKTERILRDAESFLKQKSELSKGARESVADFPAINSPCTTFLHSFRQNKWSNILTKL